VEKLDKIHWGFPLLPFVLPDTCRYIWH